MLTHKGTQTIRTARLTLRRFSVQDAQAMYDNWASSENVTRYLTWRPHDSPALTAKLLTGWCADYDDLAQYQWAITLDHEVIGSISVGRIDTDAGCADIGYCIGARWWNRGIMTEAAQAVIAYLFNEVGFSRIVITHALKNPASGAVARKCGLKPVAIRQAAFKSHTGEVLDLCDLAVTRAEYLSIT